MKNMRINLNFRERNIFNSIKKYIKTTNKKIVPRVAGGWVRDKIMGLESEDIDIVLDSVSGYDFLTDLKKSKFLRVSSIGLIKVRPEISKLKETAIATVEGIMMDFSSLKKSSCLDEKIRHSNDIREIVKDAYNRDITINSLFYNIWTGEVEDFTGKGISDIKNKIIRTITDPNKSFTECPLRILRIFRISCKFSDFKIDTKIIKTLENNNFSELLKTKIHIQTYSREIEKILNSKNFELGILNLSKYGLFDSILYSNSPPSNLYEETKSYFFFAKKYMKHEDDKEILKYYSLIFHFISEKSNENSLKSLNYTIAKEKLKFSYKITSLIKVIEENIFKISNYLNHYDDERISLIKLVKECGEKWRTSMHIYLVYLKVKGFLEKFKYFNKLYEEIINNGFEFVYEHNIVINRCEIRKRCVIDDESDLEKLYDKGFFVQIMCGLNTKGTILTALGCKRKNKKKEKKKNNASKIDI